MDARERGRVRARSFIMVKNEIFWEYKMSRQ